MTIATGQIALAAEQLEIHSAAGLMEFKAPTTLTIATGAITITQNFHLVDTEAAAASDDLDTINGGTDGLCLVVRPANDARTVVIKNGTGNIQCVGNADLTLDDDHDFAVLMYSAGLTAWMAQMGSVSASVPANVIAYTSDASAPTGWTIYTALYGRYVVGFNTNIAGTVGTALTTLENRTHTHTGPSHTHAPVVFTGNTDPGGGANWSRSNTATDAAGTGATGTATTGDTAPYINLLPVQKSA